MGNQSSSLFSVERGVCQGSVLSPTLFNLVMDPLLSRLKSTHLGLNANGLFLGVFAHADDIRTHSTSISDAKLQVSVVKLHTDSKDLDLCPQKCGVVVAAPQSFEQPNSLKVDGVCLPIEKSVKCLGV